jgi:hypothetical protein
MRDEVGATVQDRAHRLIPTHSGEIAEAALYARVTTAVRYIARATVLRRATDAEIDALEAWLDNHATPRQRAAWRDAEEELVRVDEVVSVATTLFGIERAAELLE